MLLIFLSVVWVMGIYVGSLLELPTLLCLFGLVPLLLLFFMRRQWKKIVLAGLGILLFVGAAVYSYGSLYTVDEGRVHYYNDIGTYEIKGIITGDPDIRDKSTRLTVAAEEIYLESGWREVDGTVLVTVPRYPEYDYGDFLHITGEVQTPPRLGDFDYKGYLAHQGIYTTLYYPRVQVLEDGHGFPLLAWIYDLRQDMATTLAEVLPEPQASLAQGILLGLRGNIPDDLRTDFTHSGTSHILAISGINLGIMAGLLVSFGLWLFGRRHYLYVWLAFIIIWFYTIITGMNPPVVRGAIMASMFLFGEALGRQRSGLAALTFTAAVMVGVSPYILGDASFQLSFLAMAGLIFIFPVLRDAGRRLVTSRLGDEGLIVSTLNLIIDSMSATLAAIIAVWPLIAYYFGIFSLVGPLATFLVTPVLPVIIVLGSLTMLLGLASTAVAQFFGWLVWPFLSYMILVVSGMGSPSISSVDVGWINPVFIICYYAVLAVLIWLHARWQRVRSLFSGAAGVMKTEAGKAGGITRVLKWAIAPLLVAAVLVTYTAATMPDDNLHVSFLDVGQGDAILVQKGSRQVLIDGGPSPQSVALGLSRQMPFWDRSIDLVVLTHPHGDHLAGLLEVLRRYDVGQVLYPSLDYESSLYREWLRYIGETGIASTVACTGQRIDMGDGVILEVLWPTGNPISESDADANSVVLMLEFKEVKFLLTGDCTGEAEWELIRERAGVNATVIKVGHHGSITSTTAAFLAVVDPRVAVICVGANNTYGLPDDEVITRLEFRVGEENIYRTDRDGTITFITDGYRLWVEDNR
ncbi:MAG: DNA internalization-related competence protein ComEC/Rec2 [Dehalococcoidales bacterium]|nr:DNA internalization-related competence protein ComEC/Rec2 [Dehalococcoidales bacterium]